MKEFIRWIILAAGYEIHRKYVAAADPFRQQSLLLSGVSAPVIFDVGAHTGTVAVKYRHSFPGACIHAFEPFPWAFKELERRVSADDRTLPHSIALGRAPGRDVLRVNTDSTTNSLLDTDDSAVAFWGEGLMKTTATVEVEVTTIDEFCRENRIEHVDVLKMDTQGNEHEILRGALSMLSEGRISVIYTEVIVCPAYKGQSKPHELMGFLDNLGYDLLGLYNLWRRDDGRLKQMDAIFVRSNSSASNSPA